MSFYLKIKNYYIELKYEELDNILKNNFFDEKNFLTKKKYFQINNSPYFTIDSLNDLCNDFNNSIKNQNFKICICIHLYQFNLFSEFTQYIDNVLQVFSNVLIIFNIDVNQKKLQIENKIKYKYPNSVILYNENKGVDIYSFLKMIDFLKTNNLKIDFILKIHTKTSSEIWRRNLIENITNLEILHKIKKLFLEHKDEIGFIASSDCIVPNDNFKYKSNQLGFKLLEHNFEMNLDYKYFVGGTMFWINTFCLKELNIKMNYYVSSQFSFGKPSNQSSKIINFEYIYERILSGVLTKNYNNYKTLFNKIILI